MNIYSIIPKSIKLEIRKLYRSYLDKRQGYRTLFAKAKTTNDHFGYSISVTQPIKNTGLYENKIENIKLASKKVNQIIIESGQIFSFWKIVGKPNKKNGFKKGRNLINGILSEDYGGGLCQVASIMYHLSLMAGFEIFERRNHSVDIYSEESRFTPLGADAAVVYGYIDFRFRNNYDFPVRYIIEINDNQLTARLLSASCINQKNVTFNRHEKGEIIEVVGSDDKGKVLNTSKYIKSKEKV